MVQGNVLERPVHVALGHLGERTEAHAHGSAGAGEGSPEAGARQGKRRVEETGIYSLPSERALLSLINK